VQSYHKFLNDCTEYIMMKLYGHISQQSQELPEFVLSRLNNLLSSLINITKLDLPYNLLLETLCSVKSLHKLKILIISGCGFLDLEELECLYIWTSKFRNIHYARLSLA
jgi:hypothetical protein